MAFVKEEREGVKIENPLEVKIEKTCEVKLEKTCEVKLEDAFSVKYEDSDDDGIDLMAIMEAEKQYKRWEEEQRKQQQLMLEAKTAEMARKKGPKPRVPIRKICSECGSCFSDRTGLRHHMMIHTGEKPFLCLECGKRFAQKGNFQTHMRVHNPVKPFRCNRCGKRLTTQGGLKKHLSLHVGRSRKIVRKRRTRKSSQPDNSAVKEDEKT